MGIPVCPRTVSVLITLAGTRGLPGPVPVNACAAARTGVGHDAAAVDGGEGEGEGEGDSVAVICRNAASAASSVECSANT